MDEMIGFLEILVDESSRIINIVNFNS